jgi:hypothetical protein
MMPKLPEPDLYVHELIYNKGGVFLGCSNLDVVKQAHVDGETSEKIDALFSESSVRAIQEEAYKAGVAAERERCVNHLLASAARIAPEGKRTNQVDRHVADVLSTKAAELSEVK